jgi:hypothetical protein
MLKQKTLLLPGIKINEPALLTRSAYSAVRQSGACITTPENC